MILDIKVYVVQAVLELMAVFPCLGLHGIGKTVTQQAWPDQDLSDMCPSLIAR